MSKRKGLGRGLGALIPDNPKKEEKLNSKSTKKEKQTNDVDLELVQNILLSKIVPSDDNPRKNFDEEALNSLAESIKMYGIIQPLVLVKKEEDKYEIVAGERRYRAAKVLKLKEVPAIIKDLSTKDKDMISMVENIQREDLNPYEEAQAYSNIMNEYSLTQSELSEVLGKSRTYIANIVRLLTLDDFTIRELENGNITSSQGRALLTISDIFERKKYLDMLIKKEITVNEIEKKSKNKQKNTNKKDVFIRDIEERLKEALGTRVLVKKTKNKWKVNIEFTSDDEIEYFLDNYKTGEYNG